MLWLQNILDQREPRDSEAWLTSDGRIEITNNDFLFDTANSMYCSINLYQYNVFNGMTMTPSYCCCRTSQFSLVRKWIG